VTLEQQVTAQGLFSAREAALVGIDLCRALAAIHAAGLLHRDVKAQNVMREEGGRIVLMDLGTGREADARGRRFASDMAGTPLYLAPEIFTGTPASERTDLYSLGVLLYHLVTGSFPVRATTIDELQDGHAAGAMVRLRDARADLPTAFVRVVDRAIAANPARRYESAGALEADLADSLGDVSVPTRAKAESRARWLGWPRVAVVCGVFALIAAAVVIGWPSLRRTSGVTPGTIRSIVVLPLANMSGDPAQEYFADGMTDELIGTLGELGGLNVISRTSAMQFKGSKKPLSEIARTLHVDAVLEGSVVVTPGSVAAGSDTKRVRINARLIHAGTDTQLWDRVFERIGPDVLALQSAIARAVADGIDLRLTSRQERVLTRSGGGQARAGELDAFDLYLKGRYYWNTRSEEGLKRSIQYFQEAIDRDPRSSLGYAGLADAYNLVGYYGFLSRDQARERASAAAIKALELNDSLAEAHASLGFLHWDQFEWDAAEASYKRALAVKPGYATAHHWLAYQLAQRGRFAEAIDEIRKAVALDPLSVGVNGAFGGILVYARQYDDAIAQLTRTVEMDPGFARNRTELAKAYALKGLGKRALEEADKAAALGVRDVLVRADIGFVDAVAGRPAEARKIVDELVERHRRHEDGAATGVAIVYAGLGARQEALDWLDIARRSLDPELGGLKADPRFESVRGDARFGKLLATIGLSQ
jgi:TolB-like protein/Flp pilus assembly protein TadD